MIVRVSYQTSEEEKLIFEWIDKIIEFLPEFEQDIFSSLLNGLNCSESSSVKKNIGETMLRLKIFEKAGEHFIQFSDFGREVKKLGNYSKYLKYREQLIEKEQFKHDREMENLKFSIKINKWLLRTKWLPHLLSALALIISIIALFSESK